MHSGEGAVVCFNRKLNSGQPDEEWQDLGAIKVPELREKWNHIRPFLDSDIYFSLNSTFEQSWVRVCSRVTGLPMYSRKSEHLRWLNCVWADLDIYNVIPGCSFDEALRRFLGETSRNGLPEPNLICSSGRGMWGLWLLRDDKNLSTPVPAYPDKREIHQRVNQELVKRFEHLGADQNCKDAARVMRVPGSRNTKAEPERQIVQFYALGNEVHALPEMASILGVPAQKVWLPGERRNGPKNEAKVKAGKMRWRRPLDGFRQLWKIRGTFDTGVRHHAVYIYAMLLRRSHVSEETILEACATLALSCRPDLSNKDVARCVQASKKQTERDYSHSISHTKIARMLKITEREKAQLTDWFKPARRSRMDKISERRRLIHAEICSAGNTLNDRGNQPSARKLVKLLAEQHGIHVTHVTVLNDIRFLQQECWPESAVTENSTSGKFPMLVDISSHSCTSRQNLPVQEVQEPSLASGSSHLMAMSESP